MTDFVQWEGFQGRIWKEEVNTRDFIQKNYRPTPAMKLPCRPTEATDKLWVLCRFCRRKSAPRAAFWIWRLKWFPA